MIIIFFPGHNVPEKRYKSYLPAGTIFYREGMLAPPPSLKLIIIGHSLGILNALNFLMENELTPIFVLSIDGCYIDSSQLFLQLNRMSLESKLVAEKYLMNKKIYTGCKFHIVLFRYLDGVRIEEILKDAQHTDYKETKYFKTEGHHLYTTKKFKALLGNLLAECLETN